MNASTKRVSQSGEVATNVLLDCRRSELRLGRGLLAVDILAHSGQQRTRPFIVFERGADVILELVELLCEIFKLSVARRPTDPVILLENCLAASGSVCLGLQHSFPAKQTIYLHLV